MLIASLFLSHVLRVRTTRWIDETCTKEMRWKNKSMVHLVEITQRVNRRAIMENSFWT